jgi:hypothetical protein
VRVSLIYWHWQVLETMFEIIKAQNGRNQRKPRYSSFPFRWSHA